MKKVKSALEIAMEKTKDMSSGGEIDKDNEVERQKYIKAAITLARSFLQEKIDLRNVQNNISRYPAQFQKEARYSFLEEITSNMELSNTPRILEAITGLYEDENTAKACKEAENLYQQFLQRKEENQARFEESADRSLRNELATKGIRGSAIKGFNIKKMKKWQEFVSQLEEEYKNILQNFRKEILKGKEK